MLLFLYFLPFIFFTFCLNLCNQIRFILFFGGMFLFFVSSLFSNTSLQYVLLDRSVFIDDITYWILFVVLIVFLVRNSSFFFSVSPSSMMSFFSMFTVCILFFFSANFFEIFILYEFSLIPIVYIIVKWGVYSERSKSSIYIMLYTTFFTMPLVTILIYFYSFSSFLLVSFESYDLPLWLSIYLLRSFLVKFPIYGLHYWLPQAHVEAPTAGSMILAGILLKLGGYSLFRLFFYLRLTQSVITIFISYVVVVIVLVSIVSCIQADFKRLIAYSSVVHITSLCLLLFLRNILTPKVYLIIIIFHGLLSPLLFYFVSLIYKLYSTRILYLLSSIIRNSYLLYFFSIVCFTISIPTPPFPQFYYEVLMFVSITSYFYVIMLVLVLYTFLSLVYNLIWFISTSLTRNYLYSGSNVELRELLIMVLLFISILIVFINILV
jgi:NADH:ubiquinone oxidoreductase subunit 4 (subunit M)